MSQARLRDHPNPVLIDTDIGDDIDDALALALALNSPEIELLGVTTVFGDTVLRARLAAHILHVYGRTDVPVAAGIEMPLKVRHAPSGVPQAAMLGKVAESYALSNCDGPELIIKTALAHPNRLTLLCLGPLTNVASALQREPRLATTLQRIIFIGSTRTLPFPEWNVRSDRAAAQLVLASGVRTTLIGWNVTSRCHLRERDLQKLSTCEAEQTRMLSQLIAIWQRHRPRWHPPLPYLHDPLAVVALCAPEFLTFEEMRIQALTWGLLSGFASLGKINGSGVEMAMRVRAEEARGWIMERLLGASP